MHQVLNTGSRIRRSCMRNERQVAPASPSHRPATKVLMDTSSSPITGLLPLTSSACPPFFRSRKLRFVREEGEAHDYWWLGDRGWEEWGGNRETGSLDPQSRDWARDPLFLRLNPQSGFCVRRSMSLCAFTRCKVRLTVSTRSYLMTRTRSGLWVQNTKGPEFEPDW